MSKPRCPKRLLLDLGALMRPGGLAWAAGVGGVLELDGGLICFGAAPRAPLWGTAWYLSRP